MVGGYRIIDFKMADITIGGVIVPGVYEAIESAGRKPILLQNFLVNGKEQTGGTYSYASSNNGEYLFFITSFSDRFMRIRIKGDDRVSIDYVNYSITGAGAVASEDGPSASM